MTLVKKSGGRSIAVYPKTEDSSKVKQIYNDERVSFISKADYSAGGTIEKIFKLLIDKIELEDAITKTEIDFASK